MELLKLFIQSTFIDNMVFSFFFGMCSYIAVSKSVKTANGLGLAVTFVMLMTVPLNYLLENYVLKAGALSWISPSLAEVDLSFLSFILFIAVIAAFVQLLEMVVEKFSPSLYNSLGIFLPLITTNCCVMGVTLMVQRDELGLVDSLIYAFATGAGFLLALILMAGVRERLETCRVPKAMQGTPIALLMAGIMALAFMAFKGMV